MTQFVGDYLAEVYDCEVIFEGDSEPLNVEVYATALDRQRYPAYTIIYYGYKPTSNSATITVVPQATEVAMPTKTPEQL